MEDIMHLLCGWQLQLISLGANSLENFEGANEAWQELLSQTCLGNVHILCAEQYSLANLKMQRSGLAVSICFISALSCKHAILCSLQTLMDILCYFTG